MRSISMLTLGALLALATPARADQCAKNSRLVADRAAALVQQGATVVELCEPCGDVAPSKPFTVQRVSVRDGELLVNGAVADLAYLFLRTGPDELVNVGLRTRCGAADVSEAIRNGKPTGPVKAQTPYSARGPLPPPPPRATSAAELAGTWNVRLTTRYSSCTTATTPPTPPAFAEWTIAYDQGQVELTSDTGADLSGTLDPGGPPSLFRATLKPRQRPSGAAIYLSMFLKDRFSGWAITSMKTHRASDPICVIYQELQATRH